MEEQNMKKKGNTAFLCICMLLIGAVLTYAILYYLPEDLRIFGNNTVTNITKLEKEVTVNENGIADAVEKVYDSVVVVSTYKSNKMTSSGTGFVYKLDGKTAYILTNHHVISGGDKITVTFTDSSIEEVKVIGSNEYTDIAVLSIASDKILSVSPIGSSSDARIGDTTFAVGAPLDSAYSWTVTRGIISGKDRMVSVSLTSSKNSDYVMKVLQTDAAINSGNSGGPLCSSNGEVIGITSMKLVTTGVEGMGFAIPIEDALKSADSIIGGETFIPPYIGISMLDFSTAYYYQEYYSLIQKSNLTKGVVVVSVETNSPAGRAGLQEKDIITKVGNIEVASTAYLRYALYQHKIGESVTITYYRDGQTKTTNITLASSAGLL